MPSFRARIINALLRLTVKPMWQPGLAIEDIRRHTAKTDRRLAKRGGDCPTEEVTIAGVRATHCRRARSCCRQRQTSQ